MEEIIKAPQIIAPINAAPATPEEAAKGEDTVTMVFDNPVMLTVSVNHKIHYTKGVHEVPRHLADHWYLKAHGVKPYAKPVSAGQSAKTAAAAPVPVPTGLESLSREELLIMAKGYGLSPHPSTGAVKLIEKIKAAKAASSGQPPSGDAQGADQGAGIGFDL